MQASLVEFIDDGAALRLPLDDVAAVHVYVAVSEPDVEAVANIVPESQFQADGNIHVFAILSLDEAPEILEEAISSVDDQDTIVFLCQTAEIKDQVICQLCNVAHIDNLIN